MGGGSAGQQQSRPTTASETLTGGMSKGRERRIKAAAGFRLRLSDRIHLLLLPNSNTIGAEGDVGVQHTGGYWRIAIEHSTAAWRLGVVTVRL